MFQEKDYDWREHDPYALAKFEVVKSWLPKIPRSILDVGCGSGDFSVALARDGFHVIALDPNAKACSMVRAKAESFGLKNIMVIQKDFYDFSSREKFDIVLSLDVLEHVSDEEKFILHVKKLLHENGSWILSVPALQFLYGNFDVLLGHRERYDKSKIRRGVGKYFSIARLRYFGFFFIPLALLYSKVLKTSYPVQKGSSGFLGAIMRILCRIERTVPAPLGTSLLAKVKHKKS
ncbi:methyltransferase domain-containing protein [Candidatus Woesearchaeota archaeon]|nr:methyltransferase domain-containing protein [Candidatus Woesearchaeota archaeon]